MSDLIGKKYRFILTNNFHYNGVVIDETEKTITLVDQKGVRVQIAKHSILVQEEAIQ